MQGKIVRVILFVKDTVKCAEFYRDVLGLKIIGKINTEWIELKAGGVCLALHKSGMADSKRKDSNVKIVFGAKDVSKLKKEIESKGCKMGKIISFDDIKFCDGYDIEGNRFQISDR